MLLAAWLNYVDTQRILLPVLAGCALHELGHLAALTLLDARIKLIRLTAVGAEIRIEGSLSWPGELAAALSGPAANLLCASIFCQIEGGAPFGGINLALGCFNLLPARRLDGGRALSALLSMALGPEWGIWIAGLISGAVSLGILLLGGYVLFRTGNVTMALAGVWMLASGEDGGIVGKRLAIPTRTG